MPIPIAARSEAWVCALLLAWIVGSNTAGARMSIVSGVWSGRGFCDDLITHPEEYDRETVTIRRIWPTRIC